MLYIRVFLLLSNRNFTEGPDLGEPHPFGHWTLSPTSPTQPAFFSIVPQSGELLLHGGEDGPWSCVAYDHSRPQCQKRTERETVSPVPISVPQNDLAWPCWPQGARNTDQLEAHLGLCNWPPYYSHIGWDKNNYKSKGCWNRLIKKKKRINVSSATVELPPEKDHFALLRRTCRQEGGAEL